MEDPTKTADSVTISDIPRLPRRQFVPDVPEDVEDEIALHFNDPNWDFQANSSTFSIVSDGVQPKRRSKTASHVDTKTEADTESEASAWHVHDARGDFSSEGKQVQWVSCSSSFCLVFFTFTYCVLSETLHILRSARPSETPTTQLWS